MGAVSMGKSVAFITMGCAKNEVDSARMSARLSNCGYSIIDDPESADAIIVNTCSFIQAATEESIDAVLDASGLDNVASGRAHLVVAGCMPARYGSELESELPEASRFVPCSAEDDIVDVLDGLFGIERMGGSAPYVTADFGEGAVSAYVKISDGCDRFCSYCTIPYIRGRYHSFSEEDIEREVVAHVNNGVREIVLIAQDTGRWGDDLGDESGLAGLVSRLAERHPDTWFRVMYIQPEGVTDELIDAFASHENICSYFDIPFQHCSSEVLKNMNRTGSSEDFLALVDRIRTRIPDVTLRTTLIAGFPGETEEQFEDLCAFVEDISFDYVGTFPYSQETGTRAGEMDGQIDEDTKIARAQQVRDIADAVSVAIVGERVGREVDVLVCGEEEDGQVFGRAMCQAPDVDGLTYLPEGAPGDVVRVVIEDTLFYEMEGAPVSERL